MPLVAFAILRDRVPFLGHVVSTSEIEPDPEKTEKIKNFPTPTDVTEVRCFLRLASFYRRFVPNFTVTAAPLNKLTKKNTVFEWSEDCEESFNKIKHALVTTPVLVYPKFGLQNQFILKTDTSAKGLGAVLSQMQDDGTIHPVTFDSHSIDKYERNYEDFRVGNRQTSVGCPLLTSIHPWPSLHYLYRPCSLPVHVKISKTIWKAHKVGPHYS